MKKILMIATGGTIASRQTEHGLMPQITSEEILNYIPGVASFCSIDTIQLFNLDSTNVCHTHWLAIVSCIKEHYDSYDGFVITHGTDTLAYTAAALSYLIQKSPKPIVLTGSQITIAAENTDARDNLYNAFVYASDENACNVHVIFDHKIILGTRARKSRTKSYNAFSSIDFPETGIFRDHHIIYYLREKKPANGPVFYETLNPKVFVLKLVPGIRSDIFEYLDSHYDAVVLESFGVGGIPHYENDSFETAIRHFIKKGKTIVITTQVAHEGSDMEVYAVGQTIKQKYDLLEAFDMTTEAIVTKLEWILGQTNDPEKIRELFYTPILKDFLSPVLPD